MQEIMEQLHKRCDATGNSDCQRDEESQIDMLGSIPPAMVDPERETPGIMAII